MSSIIKSFSENLEVSSNKQIENAII